MARNKKSPPEPPAIAPWMATFSDLMNLLLCFFVLLFSLSSTDTEAFDRLAQSFRTSVSVLKGGAAVVGDEPVLTNGVTSLKIFDNYFKEDDSSNKDENGEGIKDDTNKGDTDKKDAQLGEAENMAGEIEKELESGNLTSDIEVNFTSQYVELVLNGSLLFASGTDKIKNESKMLLNKIGDILWQYDDCEVEIIGHTDNVQPSKKSKFDTNLELSCARAISVAEYLNAEKGLPMSMLKTSGRGEYEPVASNETSEGRAQNRRVEIKIHFDTE